MVDPELQSLGIQLGELAVRNTASAVASRVTAVKASKKAQETIAVLEEIVDDLVADKAELTRIARAFDEQLVAQRLSETDIAYIVDNLVPIVRKLASATADDGGKAAEELMDLLTPVLSAETVTVLQLVGFNFKEAIGGPLTEFLASLIRSRRRGDPDRNVELQLAIVQRDSVLAELALDSDAHERWREMHSQ